MKLRVARFEPSDVRMIEVYRAMSPDRRIQAGLDMTDLVRARLATHLTEWVGLPPDQVADEVARRRRVAGD